MSSNGRSAVEFQSNRTDNHSPIHSDPIPTQLNSTGQLSWVESRRKALDDVVISCFHTVHQCHVGTDEAIVHAGSLYDTLHFRAKFDAITI